ncbi:MAG TPA: ATP-binding protein [Alphaproteobacteria bacterium]
MQIATPLVPTAPAASLGRTRLSWIAFGAAAVAALAFTLAANLWLERERIVEATQTSATKLALALDAHTRSVFETVDNVLRSTQRELEVGAVRGDIDTATARAILERNAEDQRVIHSLSLRDRDGRMTLITLLSRSPMNDTSRSDYFRVHRDDPAKGTYIGTPIRSIVTGEWMIPVSRRLKDGRGNFAGVLVAAVPLRFFADFFRSLQVGDRAIVTLLRNDRVMLVREPAENHIGERIPEGPLFNRYLPQSPTGTFRANTVSDGIDRIFAYRAVTDLPLVVTIGIALDDALASWSADVRVYIAVWLGCSALLAVFTILMFRSAGRREAAERLVREAEGRFRRLVANVPGVVFQRALKADGTITYNYLSSNAQKVFGYPAEAMMRNPSLLIDRIHPEDQERFEAALAESAASISTLMVEQRIIGADGVTRWVQTTSTPSRLPTGDVVWDGLMIDITDRKETEIALKRSEAEAARSKVLLTDAIESINGGFVLYDAEDRLVLVNRNARDWHPDFAAAAVPGVTFEELLRVAAKTGRIVGGGDDIETMVNRRMAVHRKAYGQPIERRVDGRWYQITEYPTSDGGVVVLRTDVTVLKEANLRLEEARLLADQANRAKSEFLAMMSHELRTPLNAVLGFAEILRDHAAKLRPEKITEYVGDIHSSGTHLLTLINDVLDLSKAEAGKMELYRAPMDVTEIVDRCVRMVRERAVRQNVQLMSEIVPGLPELWADERKVMQILLNVLSNAVKFTPENGRVTMSAFKSSDWLVIRIADTGVGIAAENIAKVLSPFGQVDNLFTRQHAGTGLGLPLAKRLAELHGAVFDLTSEVGVGTVVTIRFPVAERIAA